MMYARHYMTRTPEYNAWSSAVQRCYNTNDRAYARYGGRGITMWWVWRYDPAAFILYMGSRPSPKHSLERINNDGNYEPGNVRWATKREQALNRRKRKYTENSKVFLLYVGCFYGTLYEWADALRLNVRTLYNRKDIGLSNTEILFGKHKDSP